MKEGLGKKGEELAIQFLQKRGFKILERNFRSPWGEIDIVARERGVLCFIEVKTRKSLRFGQPFESVNGKKQQHLIRAAQAYLLGKNLHHEESRFDVVGILLPDKKAVPEFELIRNAFPGY